MDVYRESEQGAVAKGVSDLYYSWKKSAREYLPALGVEARLWLL